MGRAEPRAGEHRDGELRHHPHVDRDGGALTDADLLQRVRHPDDVALQLGVGDRPRLAGGLTLPVVGDALAVPRLDVAVDAVVGDVQLAAEIPLRVGQLPAVELRERLEPRHALAAVALPERLERLVVDVRVNVCLRRKCLRRRKSPLLVGQRLDRMVTHGLDLQVVRELGENFAAVGGHENEILEPNATDGGVVAPWLERDHVAREQRAVGQEPQVRPLVHLEPHAVAEPVEEAAISTWPAVFVRWVA